MLIPRDYQTKCHFDTINYLYSKIGEKPGMVINPTGAGKSINIAMLTKEYGDSSLIISPSQEILSQNYKKFVGLGGKASIYSASFNSKEIGHVTYATLGSIKKLGKVFREKGVSLLIMDEVHLNSNPEGGMFKEFLRDLQPKHTLGYTATPFRLKSYTDPSGYGYSQLTMMNRSRPKFFSNIVHVTQVGELVSKGFWAPIEPYSEPFNPVGLILNSTGAEYTDTSIEKVVVANNVNNKIYKKTKRLIAEGFNSILLFLDTVGNCYKMATALGPHAAVVEAKTKPKERKRILEEFQTGTIKVVCCVSTLTTGFDFPELQVVMLGRPTNSLAVFYQIYGRLVRPSEDKIGYFYDFAGNLEKFGRMENLVIEDFAGYGWGVFTNDVLLTGVPMGGEPITKEMLLNIKKPAFRSGNKPFFEFGVHKGKPLDQVPLQYMGWACENAKSNMSETLYNLCKQKIATK